MEIYLYSAYYDDRPALTRPCLRIIGIAETHATNLVCLIWYHGQGHPDVSRAQKKEVSSKISPQLEKRYEAYVFTCNMLQNKTTTPESVSLVTTLHKVPTNLLTVQYPVKPSAAATATTHSSSTTRATSITLKTFNRPTGSRCASSRRRPARPARLAGASSSASWRLK